MFEVYDVCIEEDFLESIGKIKYTLVSTCKSNGDAHERILMEETRVDL
jgi:hypothetical protein